MALTPEIRAPQAYLITGVRQNADALEVPQAYTLAAVKFPAENINAAQNYELVGYKGNHEIDAAQAYVIVAGRGRIGNPTLRAWTFSLDGHDFYVLRLGDTLTLVYDLYSEQWVDWSTLGVNFWRANIGMNWVGAEGLAHVNGSNVIVGDDAYGLLWFLDPGQPYDQHPDYLKPTQEIYFERIVMGQVVAKGREAIPCYAAFLTADMGDPAYTGAGITLSISDDAGKTFDDMGTITITLGDATPMEPWVSLGQITAPGRLFKIVDDGAVTRIDGLEMNDDAG